MKTYRSIFISDVHLGTRSCKADELANFLKNNTAETYYLVGDIIDGWRVQQGRWKWMRPQSKVVQRIFKISREEDVKIIFIPGNHDEFLRPILKYSIQFKGLELHNQYCHVGVDGKRYLVTHGDLFDGVSRLPYLSHLGDIGYDILLGLNNVVHFFRSHFGLGYWSLSKYLKHRVKKAVDFMFKFEHYLSTYCKKKGYDGVICGHIHKAEIKMIDGIVYMNDGDWVESCTALVEYHDGRFEIVTWTQKEDPEVVTG